MTDFKAKMHQIRFRLGLRLRLGWGANSAPPDSLGGLRGPTSKGTCVEGGEGVRWAGERKEGEEREGRRGENGKMDVCSPSGVWGGAPAASELCSFFFLFHAL